MDQPVVRHRLAKAGGLLESQWAWVEQFAYQMTQMRKDDADRELGGMTGLLKAQAGIIFRECADTAMLLFGGNGFTRSGQGELVESKSSHLLCSFFLLATSRNIVFWSVLICAFRSDLSRGPWSSYPGGQRGCSFRSRCETAR